MTRRLISITIAAALLFAPGASRAADPGFTTLDVDGEQVQIYRDEFGVPHIFAETNRGLFEAYGYTVAEDRLWQLELNRRAREGRLAEILGAGSLAADRNARTLGHPDAELDAQFASLSAEEQGVIDAYVDGINRYLTEVVGPNPAHKLPFEFHDLNIGVPAPWTVRDVVAVTVGRVVDPPLSGQRELANQSLLASLTARYGPAEGLAVFNDVRWLNARRRGSTNYATVARSSPWSLGRRTMTTRGAAFILSTLADTSLWPPTFRRFPLFRHLTGLQLRVIQ